MQNIVEGQLIAAKSTDFGARPGAFNVLNVPQSVERAAGADFFDLVNRPFLDMAIQRGDDIALATIPKAKVDLIDTSTGGLKGNFAKEVSYLVKADIKPINISAHQWEMVKGWFK